MKRSALAIHGGSPVRETLLPYGRHSIDEDDVAAVVEALRSDWITTGPRVEAFEQRFAEFVGTEHAVAFSSGTAALHGAAHASGLAPGDEAITPALTFPATANCVLYQGATPVFADIRADTLNVDATAVAARVGPRTRAVLPVDFGGQPADLDAIGELASRHGLTVIEDASHAPGAEHHGRRVGSISHMTVFSFHPVKHVATGEGGMVTTADAELARRMRRFRNHGIESDARRRQTEGQWYFEMTDLGYNYRLSDLACALGISQLSKLEANLRRRREIADRYREAFAPLDGLRVPTVAEGVTPAWHLFSVLLELERLEVDRAETFRALRAEGIGVNVHYIPVHLHPYYQKTLGTSRGDLPVTEDVYERLLTLPLFHGMTDADAEDVVAAVRKVLEHYAR